MSTPFGATTYVLSLEIAPIKRPTSNTTLSRGDGLDFLRLFVISSGVSTITPKSDASVILMRSSIVVFEASNTPFDQRNGTQGNLERLL